MHLWFERRRPCGRVGAQRRGLEHARRGRSAGKARHTQRRRGDHTQRGQQSRVSSRWLAERVAGEARYALARRSGTTGAHSAGWQRWRVDFDVHARVERQHGLAYRLVVRRSDCYSGAAIALGDAQRAATGPRGRNHGLRDAVFSGNRERAARGLGICRHREDDSCRADTGTYLRSRAGVICRAEQQSGCGAAVQGGPRDNNPSGLLRLSRDRRARRSHLQAGPRQSDRAIRGRRH